MQTCNHSLRNFLEPFPAVSVKCVYENCALSLTDLHLGGSHCVCRPEGKGIGVYKEVVGGWLLCGVLLEKTRRRE